MANVFQTTDHITSSWPLAVRLFGLVVRTIDGARAHWRRCFSGRVALPRVSSEWLLEHEMLSNKHQDDI